MQAAPPVGIFQVTLSGAMLSDFTDVRRSTIVPQQFRREDFDDNYDSDSLFYDCFYEDETTVTLVSAPFHNLSPFIKNASITAYPSLEGCKAHILERDRVTETTAKVPPKTQSLRFETGIGNFTIKIRPSGLDILKNQRVLMTRMKNNKLIWLQDFARFHRDIHGVESILLYDNCSTDFPSEAVIDALQQVNGLRNIVLVTWPYKFGPIGDLKNRESWLGFYSQYGIFHHARLCFLNKAKSVLNVDIDELVLSLSGRSVFEAVEKSLFGLKSFWGRWVIGIQNRHENLVSPRHKEFDTVLQKRMAWRMLIKRYDRAGSPPKWAVVPDKTPRFTQWGAHRLQRSLYGYYDTDEFSYRHFREVNNSFIYNRSNLEDFDPEKHEEDYLLKAHFARVNWEN